MPPTSAPASPENFDHTLGRKFAYEDAIERDKITGLQDTTYFDKVYTASWVQAITGKSWPIQPFVRAGAGQLNIFVVIGIATLAAVVGDRTAKLQMSLNLFNGFGTSAHASQAAYDEEARLNDAAFFSGRDAATPLAAGQLVAGVVGVEQAGHPAGLEVVAAESKEPLQRLAVGVRQLGLICQPRGERLELCDGLRAHIGIDVGHHHRLH